MINYIRLNIAFDRKGRFWREMPFMLRDKTDIKIFILYLLMHIERPVDFATLHDIVVQDDFVGQFDFMDCFYELCEIRSDREI